MEGVTGFYVPSVEISSLIREGIVGGLSVCMQRECIKGVTPIRSHIIGEDALRVGWAGCFDIKSSYPAAMRSLEVAGVGIVRRKKEGYVGEFDDPLLEKNYWAELMARYYGWKWKAKHITTRMNGKEYHSKNSGRKFLVDVVFSLKDGRKVGLESLGHAHYCTTCAPHLMPFTR